MFGFACAGQQKRHFGPGNGTSSGVDVRPVDRSVEVDAARVGRTAAATEPGPTGAWTRAPNVALLTQANGSDNLGLAPSSSRPLGRDGEGASSTSTQPPTPTHPTPLTLIGPEDRRVGQSEGG